MNIETVIKLVSDRPKLHEIRCICGNVEFLKIPKRFERLWRFYFPTCSLCHRDLVNIWYIDLSGMKFGKLTVLNYLYTKKEPYLRVYFDCRCDCGEFCEISSRKLRYLHARECGNCHKKMYVTNITNDMGLSEHRDSNQTK